MKVKQAEAGRWIVVHNDGTATSFPDHPTMQAAERTIAKQQEWDRYFAIKGWLLSIGVCQGCAVQMAFGKVEREAGRFHDWKAARGVCKGVACKTCPHCVARMSCRHPLSCEDIAKQNAGKAPPKEPPAPVAEQKGKAA